MRERKEVIQKITQQVQLSMEVKHFVIISTLRKTISTTYTRLLFLLLVIGSIVCTRKSSSSDALPLSLSLFLTHTHIRTLYPFNSIPYSVALCSSLHFSVYDKGRGRRERIMFYPMYMCLNRNVHTCDLSPFLCY